MDFTKEALLALRIVNNKEDLEKINKMIKCLESEYPEAFKKFDELDEKYKTPTNEEMNEMNEIIRPYFEKISKNERIEYNHLITIFSIRRFIQNQK